MKNSTIIKQLLIGYIGQLITNENVLFMLELYLLLSSHRLQITILC